MMRNWIFGGLILLAVVGCDKPDTAETTPAPLPASPGAAPTYGKPSGMGFSTGDAAHSSGQGSGLMGYHGTGAMGTSNAITDKHEVDMHGVPELPKATSQPVLPAP